MPYVHHTICWYITHAEKWDREALNLVGPAYISFYGRSGSPGMIAITAGGPWGAHAWGTL